MMIMAISMLYEPSWDAVCHVKLFVVGLQRPDQIDKDPSKRHLRGLAERQAILKTPLAPSDFSDGNEYLSEICREAF